MLNAGKEDILFAIFGANMLFLARKDKNSLSQSIFNANDYLQQL